MGGAFWEDKRKELTIVQSYALQWATPENPIIDFSII